jgi:hypothetical protein
LYCVSLLVIVLDTQANSVASFFLVLIALAFATGSLVEAIILSCVLICDCKYAEPTLSIAVHLTLPLTSVAA